MGNFFYKIFHRVLFAFAVVAAFLVLVILALVNKVVLTFAIAKMLVEDATNRNK